MGTPHGIIINVLWVWVVSYHFHVAVYQNPPKFPPAKCFPCTARKSLSRVSSNTRFWNTRVFSPNVIRAHAAAGHSDSSTPGHGKPRGRELRAPCRNQACPARGGPIRLLKGEKAGEGL